MKLLKWIVIALVWCISAATGQNLLINGSFEQPGTSSVDGGYSLFAGGATNLPGWLVLPNGVEYFDPNYPGYGTAYTSIGLAQDGHYVLDLAPGYSTTGGGIRQTFPTVAGSTYAVSFSLGTLKAFDRGDGTAHCAVRVEGASANFAVRNELDQLAWKTFDLSFTATNTTSTVTLETTDDANRHFVMVDNVIVSALIVPSPAGGVPDAWREQYFGTNFVDNPQAAIRADPDGDGANNYYEYISGTNPLDPASAPKTVPVRVDTFAGSTPGGQDGYRTNATFTGPGALTMDLDGKIWLVENTMTGFTSSGEGGNRIRMIDTNGMVTTVAGSATPGYVDGSAASSRFSSPVAMAFDSKGNAFIADRVNSLIRKLDTNGMVSTFAGTPLVYGDKDGQGTNAQFYTPASLCVDSHDNVYVADFGNYKVRKITPEGLVSTLVGHGSGYRNGTLAEAQFNTTSAVAVAPDGSLFVSDWLNGALRHIDTNGIVTTFAEGLPYIEGVNVDRDGSIYVALPGNAPKLLKFRADGSIQWIIANPVGVVDGPISEARISQYRGLAILRDGNLLVSDSAENSYRLRLITLGPAPLLTLTQTPGAAAAKTTMNLSTLATNALIRYSLDGSMPGTNSAVYDRPFETDVNAPLMAQVFVAGIPVSEIVSNVNAANFILKLATTGQGVVTRSPMLSSYPSNTLVHLSATPGAGYVFAGWTGDFTGMTNDFRMTMNGNKAVTANFIRAWSLKIIPTVGGTIQKNPDRSIYANGETVTLTAIPDVGYVFDKWSLPITSKNNPLNLVMTENKQLNAIFKIAPVITNWTAVATATVVNGFVVAIKVIDGGNGYLGNPMISIIGGNGSGAMATATVANGMVKTIVITDAGHGYTGTPEVVIAPPQILSFSDGLMAYYPFNGNALDESGNGKNATVNGAVLTSDRFGGTNRSYSFSGTSGKISVANPLFNLGQQEYTISVWFKIADLTKTRQMIMLTRTPSASGQGIPGLALVYNDLAAPGAIDYYLGVGGPEGGGWAMPYQHGTKTDYQSNKWYFLTFKKTGSVYKLYINGILEHSLNYPNSFNDIVGMNFGHNDDEPDGEPWFLDGCLDDIRLYSRALADQEIEDLYYHELPEQPSVAIDVKTVRVKMHVKISNTYQLQASLDLKSWKNVGVPFVAGSAEITQEFDSVEMGRYFRLIEP
jgi:uncharacterized repeat protein (TIGR02543 family)